MRVSGAQRGWPRPGKYGTRLGGGHRTRCCLPPRGRMGLIGCWRAAPHRWQLRRAVRHCCHPQRRAWRRRCRQRSMTGGHAIAHGPVRAPGRGSDGSEAGRHGGPGRVCGCFHRPACRAWCACRCRPRRPCRCHAPRASGWCARHFSNVWKNFLKLTQCETTLVVWMPKL